MRYGSLLLLLASAAVVQAATSCNADNCARAVTGTLVMSPPAASRSADCRSFLSCTVTPAAVTVTSTTTSTSTVTVTGRTTITPAPVFTTVTTLPFPESSVGPNRKRQASSAASNAGTTRCASSVPAYASPCSGTARYSSACSCFGITRSTTTVSASTTTTTTTVTQTTTTTVVAATTLSPVVISTSFQPAAPTTCGNTGLQWAFYNDNTGDDTSDAGRAAYQPEHLKTDVPAATGNTNYLTFRAGDGVYGNNGLPDTFLAINHRGYLFAPESGTYIFNASTVDNNLYAWLGGLAYSGWTAANDNQSAIYQSTTGVGGNAFSAVLTEGTYYPFRLVYWQGTGPASFDYSITAPSGYVLIGSNPGTAQSTPYVVQFSCDNVAAPPYPPYGAETK